MKPKWHRGKLVWDGVAGNYKARAFDDKGQYIVGSGADCDAYNLAVLIATAKANVGKLLAMGTSGTVLITDPEFKRKVKITIKIYGKEKIVKASETLKGLVT